MEWSLETYRLDEIDRKFDFPCIICLTEGFYSETDAEGFSQGDIMCIDSKLVLHKVAANFAFNVTKRQQQDPNYVELIRNEILVPLNYKGKLKVLRDVKNFNSVRELATEFPRYAKVRENMEVTTERNVQVTIQAGTVIELDRIIPGHNTEQGEQPAKLVIQFQHRTGEIVVAVPLDVRGKFRTEPDNNEYTIKEAIHRYELPQFIRFIDDEIKRVYTQDFLEGIENMKTITSETLRLNRLVSQNVLVGHYKPVDENRTSDSERFRQRTLAVLPLDKPEIREIEVHVLKGVMEDIYEQVFLVRNVSKMSSAEIVEGSLYIDFVMRPSLKIISHQDTRYERQTNEDSPPPRDTPPPRDNPPPRPPKPKSLKSAEVKSNPDIRRKDSNEDEHGYVKFNPAEGFKADKRRAFPDKIPPAGEPSPHEDLDDYEIPKTCTSFSAECMVTCLADMDFNSSGDWNLSLEKKRSGLFNCFKNKFKAKDNVRATTGNEPMKDVKQVTAAVRCNRPETAEPTPVTEDRLHVSAMAKPTKPGIKVGEVDYDQVDEWKMFDSSRAYQRPPHPLPVNSGTKTDSNTNLKPSGVKQKPTAHVAPSGSHVQGKTKQFKDLNNFELVKRLKLCGLDEFAIFCEKEHLNGAFFTDISKETLSNEMNLTGISLFKFLQMRYYNWFPT